MSTVVEVTPGYGTTVGVSAASPADVDVNAPASTEIVVAAIAGPPGPQGPAGADGAEEIASGSALPSTGSGIELFILSNNGNLPDGTYRYDSLASAWVQIG